MSKFEIYEEILESVTMPAWQQTIFYGDSQIERWLWETYYKEPMCFTWKVKIPITTRYTGLRR